MPICSRGRRAGYHGKAPQGLQGRETTFKVHLDGYNLLPYLTGQEAKSPRKEFFYFSDEGDLTALRYDNWKLIFAEQKTPGTLAVWMDPFTMLRVPLIFNLRLDPYERATITSNTYYDWFLDHAFIALRCRPMLEIPDVVQGLSAAAETGELLDRSGYGKAERAVPARLIERALR